MFRRPAFDRWRIERLAAPPWIVGGPGIIKTLMVVSMMLEDESLPSIVECISILRVDHLNALNESLARSMPSIPHEPSGFDIAIWCTVTKDRQHKGLLKEPLHGFPM